MSRELQCSTPCWQRRTNLNRYIESRKVQRMIQSSNKRKIRRNWKKEKVKNASKRKKKKKIEENLINSQRTPVRTFFLPMLLLFPYFLCCPPSPPCRAALHAGACWPWRPTRYCQPSFHAPLVALRIFLKGAPFCMLDNFISLSPPSPSLSSLLLSRIENRILRSSSVIDDLFYKKKRDERRSIRFYTFFYETSNRFSLLFFDLVLRVSYIIFHTRLFVSFGM